MPIYEYVCKKCNTIFEDLGDIMKEKKCPNCDGIAQLRPSACNHNIYSIKKRDVLTKQLGNEINDDIDLKKKLKETGGTIISKKEWLELKAKRDNLWNSEKWDKKKVEEKVAEGIKAVQENIELRRLINKYNIEKKEDTKRIKENKVDNVKI